MGGRAQKYYFIQYVPKYHQKLGCQANGGACAKILFYTICPKISSKTRMPGKWGGARRVRPPLDLPMIADFN